jgi:ferredoxin
VSLFDAAERLASIDRSQILLNPSRCLHSQDQSSNCVACFDLCPVDAITAGTPPTLDAELCQSCFACLPACPVGAFHGDDDVASLLTCATHVDGQVVELVCGLHPQPGTGLDADAIGLRIHGCLSGLGLGAYLALSALGLKRLIVRADACRSCKWCSLDREIHRQTARANEILSAWVSGGSVVSTNEVTSPVERALWDVKNPPLSRRDLFRMIARQGQVAMARAMERGAAGSSHQPGRDRLRLLAAIPHLGAPETEVEVHGLGFAVLAISDTCTACGACGKACPTGALRYEKNEKEMAFTIAFSARLCIACEICDHVCLPDAITMNRVPDFNQIFDAKDPVILASGQLVRCERCKTLMSERNGTKLCPLCEYRRTHPLGSMLPKKVMKETLS